MGKGLLIVGIYIETGGTSGFFEAAASAGNYGEAALDGFDDRDAKAFVTGGIDKGFCKVIEDGKVVVRDSTEEMKPVTLGERLHIVGLSAYGDKMEVEGKYQQLDGDGNVTNVLNNATGTLIKTVTTQSPTLTESLMVGTWKFRDSQTYRTYDVIINSDHTFTHNKYYLDEGTWEIEGSKFIGRTGSYGTEYSFIVESITSSAMSVVLNTVDGIDGNLTSITGTYTKNI